MPPESPSPLAATILASPEGPAPDPTLAQTVAATPERANGTTTVLARGATLGRYMVLDRLGEGGMGVVYTAYDPELDRKLALKLLRAAPLGGREASEGRARLLREGQAMARLSHPNVIAVHDVGTYEGEVFIAMELVEGGTLRAWLEGPRAWREVVAMFAQAGRGLAAAHDAGIVHRDFKADNVLVGTDGRARVVDFGLAHANDGLVHGPMNLAVPAARVGGTSLETPLTEAGTLLGTPRYMAPEQFGGERSDAGGDQFSFCVGLFEALYGEAPFEGNDLATLASNVRAGRVRTPRAVRDVPGWLAPVIARGLAVLPGDRHASMHTLLAALEHDPAVARRRWTTRAAVGGAVALIGLGLFEARAHRPPICPSAQPALAGVWDDGQREAVQAAFRATGEPYADDAFRGVSRALEAYAAAWVGMRDDACRATLVRGEQSSELMDLRMACLNERLAGVRALTMQFARADSVVIERALDAADGLPPLRDCADAALLRAPTRLPEGPKARERVEGVRRQLAEARALGNAAKPGSALPLAEASVTAARELGYRPLEAEALATMGELQEKTGDERAAAARLEEAVLAAEAGRHEAVEADAWIGLVRADGMDLRSADGRVAAKHAHACLERNGKDDERLARLLDGEGLLEAADGHFKEAMAIEKQALAIRERLFPPDHPDIAECLGHLGNAALEEGDLDDALAYQKRALAIREKAFGPAHPLSAISLGNLGNALAMKGDHEGSIAAFRRSLEIKIAALGPESHAVADTLNNLGLALCFADQYAEALGILQRALELRTRILGPDHLDVADSYGNLSVAQLGLRRWDDAIASSQRWIQIEERAKGGDYPPLASPLTQIGAALLSKGEAAHALPYLERALRLGEAREGALEKLAETRETLADVLVATRGDAARARRLAMQARETYARDDGKEDVARIDAHFPPR